MLLCIPKAGHRGGLPELRKAEAVSLQRGVKEPSAHISTERHSRQCPPCGPAEWQLNEYEIPTGGSFLPDHLSEKDTGLLIQEMTWHHHSWAEAD